MKNLNVTILTVVSILILFITSCKKEELISVNTLIDVIEVSENVYDLKINITERSFPNDADIFTVRFGYFLNKDGEILTEDDDVMVNNAVITYENQKVTEANKTITFKGSEAVIRMEVINTNVNELQLSLGEGNTHNRDEHSLFF